MTKRWTSQEKGKTMKVECGKGVVLEAKGQMCRVEPQGCEGCWVFIPEIQAKRKLAHPPILYLRFMVGPGSGEVVSLGTCIHYIIVQHTQKHCHSSLAGQRVFEGVSEYLY